MPLILNLLNILNITCSGNPQNIKSTQSLYIYLMIVHFKYAENQMPKQLKVGDVYNK